jgi:phosphate-selective porin OprO/OprP
VVTGRGAWEATLRASYIDLTDAGVRGGELTGLTAGLNWYLTPYVRVKINAIRSYRTGPPNGDSNASILGIRWDVDF